LTKRLDSFVKNTDKKYVETKLLYLINTNP